MNIKRIGLIGGSGVIGGSSGTGSSTTVVDNLESISKSAALSANMGRELNETKAPKVGYAPNLKVSYAEELVGRGESTPEVIGVIRPTSGEETSIKDGNATIERIKGKSVVWNQIIGSIKTKISCTVQTSNDGIITITPTLEKEISQVNWNVFWGNLSDVYIKGHVYCVILELKKVVEGGISYGLINYGGYMESNASSVVNVATSRVSYNLFWKHALEANNSNYHAFAIYYTPTSIEDTIEVSNLVLHDLTLMFGAGNEPTTIEEFEARKPLGVTNEYNEGTIVSFQGGDVKSVGFNALDCEREVIKDTRREPTTTRVWEYDKAYYPIANNGYVIPTYSVENIIITPNLIQAKCSNAWYGIALPLQLVAGVEYKYQVSSSVGQPSIMYLDKDGKFDSCIHITNGTQFTAKANKQAVYVLQPMADGQTISATNPCFHLVHSGYRNGDYEPYVDDVHPLPNIKSIKDSNGDALFPYGLLSAGSVHDEITATKAIKRIGVVDMGTLNWTYRDTLTNKPFQTTSLKGLIAESSQINCICAKYTSALVDSGAKASSNKYLYRMCVAEGANNSIILIKDDSYTSITDFEQAMQGVFLYYELAKPIEVDLPELLNMTYEAWDFGTEELIASQPTTPLNVDIAYLFNAVDRIRENSTNIEKIKNVTDNIANDVTIKNDVHIGSDVNIDQYFGIKLGTNFVIQPNLIDIKGYRDMRITPEEIQLGDDIYGIKISDTYGIQLGYNNVIIGTGVYIKSGFDSRNLTLGSGTGSGLWKEVSKGVSTTNDAVILDPQEYGIQLRISGTPSIDIGTNVTLVSESGIGLTINSLYGINLNHMNSGENYLKIATNVYIERFVVIGTKLSAIPDELTYIQKGLQFSLTDSDTLRIRNANNGKYVDIKLTETS